MAQATNLSLGIDIGSTTVKVVLTEDGQVIYEKYERHMSQVRVKTLEMLEELLQEYAEEHPELKLFD